MSHARLPPLTQKSFASSDLGYFDRSSAGNTAVSTPNLDDLFHTGVNLQRYYGYKYCSPCRRAFVTGRWPLHLGELNQVQDGIDLRMTCLLYTSPSPRDRTRSRMPSSA